MPKPEPDPPSSPASPQAAQPGQPGQPGSKQSAKNAKTSSLSTASSQSGQDRTVDNASIASNPPVSTAAATMTEETSSTVVPATAVSSLSTVSNLPETYATTTNEIPITSSASFPSESSSSSPSAAAALLSSIAVPLSVTSTLPSPFTLPASYIGTRSTATEILPTESSLSTETPKTHSSSSRPHTGIYVAVAALMFFVIVGIVYFSIRHCRPLHRLSNLSRAHKNNDLHGQNDVEAEVKPVQHQSGIRDALAATETPTTYFNLTSQPPLIKSLSRSSSKMTTRSASDVSLSSLRKQSIDASRLSVPRSAPLEIPLPTHGTIVPIQKQCDPQSSDSDEILQNSRHSSESQLLEQSISEHEQTRTSSVGTGSILSRQSWGNYPLGSVTTAGDRDEEDEETRPPSYATTWTIGGVAVGAIHTNTPLPLSRSRSQPDSINLRLSSGSGLQIPPVGVVAAPPVNSTRIGRRSTRTGRRSNLEQIREIVKNEKCDSPS